MNRRIWKYIAAVVVTLCLCAAVAVILCEDPAYFGEQKAAQP